MREQHRIEIRSAAFEELPLVRNLAYEIWPVCYREMISAGQIDYMLTRMYSLQQLRADLAAGIAFDLLLEDAVAIGFASYGPADAPGECKMHKLYLQPSRHGLGLGSLLLQHVIARAKQAGFSTLTLNVNKRNAAAIKVYRRNGFVTREEVVVDIGGRFVMDDYIMALPLA
ncbi:MAG: GNAT family N-acetyltransferase [Phycisphaerae bacterium]